LEQILGLEALLLKASRIYGPIDLFARRTDFLIAERKRSAADVTLASLPQPSRSSPLGAPQFIKAEPDPICLLQHLLALKLAGVRTNRRPAISDEPIAADRAP